MNVYGYESKGKIRMDLKMWRSDYDDEVWKKFFFDLIFFYLL